MKQLPNKGLPTRLEIYGQFYGHLLHIPPFHGFELGRSILMVRLSQTTGKYVNIIFSRTNSTRSNPTKQHPFSFYRREIMLILFQQEKGIPDHILFLEKNRMWMVLECVAEFGCLRGVESEDNVSSGSGSPSARHLRHVDIASTSSMLDFDV
jgi:hypothetical protein